WSMRRSRRRRSSRAKSSAPGRRGSTSMRRFSIWKESAWRPTRTCSWSISPAACRAAAMKQGLIDGVAVNPPNEYDLEKAGYRELANFLDFKMPYAGVPHTVSRAFRDKNRKVLEDYMTAMVEGMQIFRADRQKAYRAIFELTRQKDPVLLERTYDSYARQYDAIGGVPLPWEAGIESMITGFHERFNPQGIKNRDAKPFIDPSFVQKAVERLKLNRK